jgi:NAD(P)H-nitrite reductase large subunit
MRHVILGNGPAGVVAAETIRRHAPRDEIVLVGAEPEPPYSRMAIPYLLTGRIGEPGTWLRKEPGHFDRLSIELRTARAQAVSTQARTVTLGDGAVLPFDRLLVATGSTPVRPPIPGLELPGVHTCWTLEDARKIQALARKGARVVQMGAGFIGCIILEALAARGVSLAVVEMGDRMVPRMMGPGAGGMIRRWVEGKGIAVHTSARVEGIHRGQGAPLEVRLSTGAVLPADLVISATGVLPNVGFLQDSGVACQRGVLTDEKMESSVPGVYAAGDCAEALDLVTGERMISAIQPNAAEQASCAALNMAGQGARMQGVFLLNVLDTLGLVSSSFGLWQGVPGGQHVERSDERGFRYLRLEFHDGRLVGANTVGLVEHVGVLRGLIQSRVRLGPWQARLLEDPTLLPQAYLACAQSSEARRA